MATMTLRNEAVIAVPQGESEAWKRIKEICGSVRDLMTVYFGGHSPLELLQTKNRAQMTEYQKSEIDGYFLSLH